MTPSPRAVILFAHGSRDPQWSEPMRAVAARMQQQHPHIPVACAYLEMMEPDLASASESLIAAGILHVNVVPMFLGVGRHARHDLPLLMQALRERHRQVRFELKAAIGEDPRVVDLLAAIAAE
ncbi:MAG: CbiX/SirB N-terminal domain-containing protein [Rhodoferax sp.]|nr:CbiX/SirB N-terminal domain-containing protein [Rhodoferax sp.]